MFDPKNDGEDHINVYSRGKTNLGKWLSNFTREPIETEDGEFNSIEGYWYWLGTRKELLREASGYQAKRIGRTFRVKHRLSTKEFKRKIKKAFNLKLKANNKMRKKFIQSTLPLVHYYVEGERLIFVPKHYWLFKYMERKREKLQIRNVL
jgi:hypothetical protein